MLQTSTSVRPPAPSKVKILEVADELFYSEGIHTVGVDRIIAAARVTKATFYKHYRSKDLLIVAYVKSRHERVRALVENARAEYGDAGMVLRVVAEAVAQQALRPGFHGCPFINAAAQFGDPEHPVRVAVSAHRRWEREMLTELADELGHDRPQDAADDLLLLRDGALSGSNVGDPQAAVAALRRAVERVLGDRSSIASAELLSA